MTALGLLGLATLISLVMYMDFVYWDIKAAFDKDPDTHTASERIKRWRRSSPYRTVLLASVIACLAAIPVYLFAHLVLEIV